MKVKTNFPVIVAKLKRLPRALRPPIRKGLLRGLHYASGVAQREFLSGPRPRRLGVVTTRLRNSIVAKVTDDGKRISGRIGTNVPYARYHEFGFRGVQRVRAHIRVIGAVAGGKGMDLRRARGPIRERGGRLVGYKRSGKTAVGDLGGGFAMTQFVRAHSRTVNYRGRPFLRPALLKTERRISLEVKRELEKAVKAENHM